MRRPFRFACALASILATSGTAHAVVVERVVAVVGDKPIFLTELRTRARPFLAQVHKRVAENAQIAAAETQVLTEMLSKMVDEELEAQAAVRARIQVTPQEVDEAIKRIAASQNVSVSQLYVMAKKESGMTELDYRDEIRRQILEGKMIELRVKGRVRITEEDIRETFEKSKREERKALPYEPSWIVLRLPKAWSAAEKEKQLALAQSLAQRARTAEKFEELAKAHSDDSATVDSGGSLGERVPSAMQAAMRGQGRVLSPELEEAIMALEPGQVTSPIQVGEAVVILKLNSRKASRYTTLDSARREIIQRLQTEILLKAKKSWLDDLRKRTHVDARL